MIWPMTMSLKCGVLLMGCERALRYRTLQDDDLEVAFELLIRNETDVARLCAGRLGDFREQGAHPPMPGR